MGEAGIGKTRLVEFAASTAKRAGLQVLIGRAVPELVTSLLRPVAEALLELTRDRPPPPEDAFAPYVPLVATLLPHWRSASWRSPEEPLLVTAEAVFQALTRLIRKSGALIMFEDLHWADDGTMAIIRFLADHIGNVPIALLATARTTDGREDVVTLLGPSGAQVCHLARLSPSETEQMASACLGASSASSAELEQVVRDAEGLPLLVEDLLATGEQGGVPQRFADTVRSRLGRLDANERNVLSAAAVLGHHFEWRMLPAITGLSLDAVALVLHRCAAFQLVVADGAGFAFRHALTREIVQGDTTAADRERLCLAAAEAVANSAAGDDMERDLTVGRLLAEGGQLQQASEVLLQAGHRALARGMLSAAEPTLRSAAALADEASQLGVELRHALARTLLLAGQPAAATEIAGQVIGIAEGSDSKVAAGLRLLMARAAIVTAQWDDARAHLHRAQRTFGHDSATAAEIAVLEAMVALGVGQPGSGLAAEHQAAGAVGIARQAGRPDLECEALELMGLCARLRDLDAATDALDRALQVARTSGLPAQWLHVLNELGSVEMLRDARSDRLDEARHEAFRIGALGLAASIGLNLAALLIMTGRFDQALQVAGEVQISANRLGLVPLEGAAHLMQGFAMGHQGRGREMDRHLAMAESLAPDDAELRAGAWGIGRGLYALLQEDRTEARRALAQARLAAPHEHARILNPYEGPELLLRALAGEAQTGEAEATLKRAVRAARWPALWANCALAVARGAQGDGPGACAALSVGLDAGSRYPLFSALAQRLVAEAALRDHWGEPELLLRSADSTFTILGLGRAAAACRALLKGAGIPAPRRRKHETPLHADLLAAGVTAKEAEVLDLLADRLTNREIAERLYLSPRTVEKHVASLLDKLAVDRTALAQLARTLR